MPSQRIKRRLLGPRRARWFLAPLLCTAGALLLQLYAPGLVSGQPAMPDPAQMSGIPRPDPAVPGATVTVRLIRGELSNRVVGVDAQLIDLQNKTALPLIVKTDAEGRATFASLAPGSYEARALVDSEALASQPIQVLPAPAPGVRVMLVFSKSIADQQKELGSADGKARIDQGLPAGSLLIKAVDEAEKPLPGLQVTLVRADQASGQVEALPVQRTGLDGIARFANLASSPTLGYRTAVQRDGVDYLSLPFRLFPEHGSQLALTARSVVRDQAALQEIKIGAGSHLILGLEDDVLQVVENLRLINPRPQAIDPGPEGIRVPLGEGAMSAQVIPGSPPNMTVDASKAGPPVLVWKGPLPSGPTDLRARFILKHHGQVSFRQVVAQPFEGLRVVVEKLPGVTLEHVSELEDRAWQGKNFVLGTVQVPAIGNAIEFTITGLPAELLILRYAAAVLALGIALCFAYIALYGKPETDPALSRRRQKAEQRRDLLLAELVATEQRESATEASQATKQQSGKFRPRDKTLAELEQVYRHLDELDGN